MTTQPEARTQAISRPPTADLGIMAVAVAAVCTSGPLIAATAAPALAIAFWRNALASGLLVPIALLRARAEVLALDRRERLLALASGLLLAAHFATWIPSLTYTSVASSTAMVATQPVWAALVARAQGHEVNRQVWLGIAVAVLGVVVLSGIDFSLDPRNLFGDALALVGAAFAAAYMSVGGEVRKTVTTTTYTAACYGTCALVMLVVCVVGRQALTGYSAADWWKIVGLTAGAQLLGHSLFNRILRTTSATVVSLSILLEMPGAALLAAVFIDQTPPLAAIPAAGMVIAGIAIVVRSGGERAAPVPTD